MYTGKSSAIGSRVLVTTLTTLGWLSWMLGWMAFAWSHYAFFQNLASLGISTFVFVAIVGVMWVGDLGSVTTATILATLGWFSFALYWLGFVWSRYTLLQNGAVLTVSFLVWRAMIAVFWLARPAGEDC
jgi:hypothetical protein